MTNYVLKCDINYEVTPTLKEKIVNYLKETAQSFASVTANSVIFPSNMYRKAK